MIYSSAVHTPVGVLALIYVFWGLLLTIVLSVWVRRADRGEQPSQTDRRLADVLTCTLLFAPVYLLVLELLTRRPGNVRALIAVVVATGVLLALITGYYRFLWDVAPWAAARSAIHELVATSVVATLFAVPAVVLGNRVLLVNPLFIVVPVALGFLALYALFLGPMYVSRRIVPLETETPPERSDVFAGGTMAAVTVLVVALLSPAVPLG